MDWVDHLIAIGYAIAFSIVVTGIWSVIIKKGLGTKIERSINHEFDKKLEEFKSDLTRQYQDAANEKIADKLLYDKFLELLPSDGAIEFLKTHDFSVIFARNAIRPISTFRYDWRDAEHEFLDPELESLRKKLWDKITDFDEYTSLHTFPHEVNVKSSWVPADWKENNRKRFDETVDRINHLADDVVLAHQAFVRLARQKLKLAG